MNGSSFGTGVLADAFTKLGVDVERRLAACPAYLEDFSSIALAALKEFEAPPPPDIGGLIQLITDPDYAEQKMVSQRAGFSDLAILLYDSEHFTIEAYHWLEATTTIHDHRFSGAFRVWSGSSLHFNYQYDPPGGEVGSRQCGDLSMESVALAEVGDVFPIVEQVGKAHAIFHLEKPTITLVIRTKFRRLDAAQLNCYPPGIAVCPDRTENLARKLYHLFEIESSRMPSFDIESFLSEMPDESLILTFPYWYSGLGGDSRLFAGQLLERGWPPAQVEVLVGHLEAVYLAREYRKHLQAREHVAAVAILSHSPDRERFSSWYQSACGSSATKALAGAFTALLCRGVPGGRKLAGSPEVVENVLGKLLASRDANSTLAEMSQADPGSQHSLEIMSGVLLMMKENPLFKRFFNTSRAAAAAMH